MAADVSKGKDVAKGRGVEPCRERETWEAGEEPCLGGGEGATLGGENEGRGCRLNVGEERGGTDDAVCGEGVEVEVGRGKRKSRRSGASLVAGDGGVGSGRGGWWSSGWGRSSGRSSGRPTVGGVTRTVLVARVGATRVGDVLSRVEELVRSIEGAGPLVSTAAEIVTEVGKKGAITLGVGIDDEIGSEDVVVESENGVVIENVVKVFKAFIVIRVGEVWHLPEVDERAKG
jgi:hypothetical protein